MIALTIYTRQGCHLCQEMKVIVERVVRDTRTVVEVQEIDIANDPALEERYGLEIPVLLVDGKKAAKYRVTEEELTRILIAARGWQGGIGERTSADVPPSALLPFLPFLPYFPVIKKCPRRFCCQQASFSSAQKGASLPLLTTVTRVAGTPRLTR